MVDIEITKIKPSEINMSNWLIGSNFKSSEKESLAINIIKLSVKNNDKWIEFTEEEFKEKCGYEPGSWELFFLTRHRESMLCMEFIEETIHGKYRITNQFLDVVSDFLKG